VTTASGRQPFGRIGFCVLLLSVVLAAVGCGGHSSTASKAGSQTPSDFDFGANDPRRASAFGDSITLGVETPNNSTTIITSNSYPNVLQNMLRGLDASWRVINRGVGGETTTVGARRFPSVLGADHPGFALIMEGTNDASDEDDPSFIVANLQSMAGQAKGNKTIPVVGTIPPNFRHDPPAQDIISQANTMIRTMAQAQSVVLAEIFNGMNDPNLFGAGPSADVDPLHPNDQGYSVMAGIWFSAIQQAIPAGNPTVALRRKRK
jgi:lysophospholipase L1-like esterase